MEKLRFRRKAGLGVHHLWVAGKKIKVVAGQLIECAREELGEGFLAQYDCLDGPILIAPEKVVGRVPEIVPSRETGFFDIVNPDHPSRPLNIEPLRKKKAQKFLEDLIGSKENGEG